MTSLRSANTRCLWLMGALVLLGGCSGGDDTGSPSPSNPGVGGPSGGGGTNSAPSISGAPTSTVTADEAYRFQPTAMDSDSDPLTFRIDNKPGWATFDASTGLLTGVPSPADVGTYTGIRITVTDGTATSALAAFDIIVAALGTGQVTLSWTAPTQNADGTPLTNLAGYKIYYGRSANELTSLRKVGVGMTSVVIENLSSGMWHFSMTSYNSSGVESARTTPVSKRV